MNQVMIKEKNYAPSFTLIELLVVISIIGVLSTLLLANFNATRGRARDAQRKSDLRNIQTALRLYYNDCKHYPTNDSDGNIVGCGTCLAPTACDWGTSFATDEATYMSILPEDPSPDRSYQYLRTAPDSYTLTACLENQSDDKGIDPTSGDACDTLDGAWYNVQP